MESHRTAPLSTASRRSPRRVFLISASLGDFAVSTVGPENADLMNPEAAGLLLVIDCRLRTYCFQEIPNADLDVWSRVKFPWRSEE